MIRQDLALDRLRCDDAGTWETSGQPYNVGSEKQASTIERHQARGSARIALRRNNTQRPLRYTLLRLFRREDRSPLSHDWDTCSVPAMGQTAEWSGGHSVEWSSEYAFDRSPEEAARAVMRARSHRDDADRALEMVRLQAVRACTERGLSVRQTAKMLGLTKSAVGRIKRTLDAAPHGIWAAEPPCSISTLPAAREQVRAAWAGEDSA